MPKYFFVAEAEAPTPDTQMIVNEIKGMDCTFSLHTTTGQATLAYACSPLESGLTSKFR